MSNQSHKSLAKKLTISAILLMVGSIIIVTATAYLTIVSFGDKFLTNEVQEKSDFIAKAFSEPIWTYDQYQINEIANSLLGDTKYTYVTALKIETTNNELLFEKGQKGSNTYLTAASLPYTQTKIIDVYKDQRKIGKISMAMTNYGYITSFRNQFIIIILTAVILILVLAKFVSYYFYKKLTLPMSKILQHVNQIEGENYDHHDIEDLPKELDSISKALNQAASMIEKRNNDIRYYTHDLEKLVSERTSELEEQVVKSLNTARLAAVGEMAADVAHEINNPLTVIDLYANKLKKMESTQNISPEISNSVDKIHLMVKRIGKIIKGLRSLSRDGNGDPMVGFLVATMLDEVKMLVDMKIRNYDIQFDLSVSDNSLMARGREVQISQVLVNLIGNSIDAICHLSQKKWIKVDVRDLDEDIYFSITDCGNGIPEELRQKIMHPFFTTKEVNKGTGLGLSISKSIIEEHGGKLEYNSKSPHTQFIFTLKKDESINNLISLPH